MRGRRGGERGGAGRASSGVEEDSRKGKEKELSFKHDLSN